MAAAPLLKIYNPQNEYIAACKHAEDAAALAAFNGEGTTVRLGHKRIIWTEGAETQPAGESYDYAAGVMHERAGI